MKIISMVPSWTETLLSLDANVVGRTRFCIHPRENVRGIPVVGGTKDIDWEKVISLHPDLLLLDREENPKFMSDEAPCPVFSTHVTRIEDVASELRRLSERLRLFPEISTALVCEIEGLARRWDIVVESAPRVWSSWRELPGLIEWIREPDVWDEEKIKFVYVIWRDPWMAVSHETFIASVLGKLGLRVLTPERTGNSKYPAFEMEDLSAEAVLLFASEPFPFHRKKNELKELPFAAAIVDGESFSWFGWRSLQFLERALSINH